MQEESFLQAILADPDDDAIRLVYADWLAEHDQPERGELIRVQIALERLPEDDDRRAALIARERRLLLAHGREWKGGVRGFFERGFLERLDGWDGGWNPDEFAEQAPAICARHPIRDLTLMMPETPGWGAKLAACPQLSWLHTLRLQAIGENSFTPPNNGPLDNTLALLRSPHLTNLRSLDLGNVYFIEGEPSHSLFEADEPLPALRNLQRLNLNSAQFTDAAVQALVTSPVAKTLTYLDLSHNPITPNGLRILYESPLWSRLEELNLTRVCPNAAPNYTALAEAIARSRLRRLNLVSLAEQTNSSETLIRALASVPSCGALRTLSLHRVEDLESLAASPNLLGLTGLDMRGTDLTDDEVRMLVNSRHIRNLTALAIHLWPDADQGLIALAASPFLSRLIHLEVWAGDCSRAGLSALVNSPNLRHVRVFQFFGLDGDEALEIIAASPHLGHLSSLYYTGGRKQVTAAGVNAVAMSKNMPHLSYLLPGGWLSSDGVQALLDARHVAVFHINESDLTTEHLRTQYQARTDRECGCDFFRDSRCFTWLG